MQKIVDYELYDQIAIITIDNPPVNALSHPVRVAISDATKQLESDNEAKAGILICAGRTFFCGADISEFDKPIQDPWLPKVVQQLEDCTKPIIAAIHGHALGGGLEIAMGCHYRCAVASARIGLPEVKLGLLPGATGTQRLPRLCGINKALDMMISGSPIPAQEAREHGIIDEIIDDDLKQGAISFARELIKQDISPRQLSKTKLDTSDLDTTFFDNYRKKIARQSRGQFAPTQIIKCIEAASNLPYADGLNIESDLFEKCKASSQSQALRYLFFAERKVAQRPDVPKDSPQREISKVAIVGAGTMGTGIAMNFINAGFPVTILEMSQEALERGLNTIQSSYESNVNKGRITEQRLKQNMELVHGTIEYSDLADADLIIEAVFENMDAKKEVFKNLDTVCKQGAIFATNTSTLDINEIADQTSRPEDVIGLHFFAPANIMLLLEVVRGDKTSKDVIASCMSMAKKIKKTAVVVGVCFGFVGNRMFLPYLREAQMMILEGVSPERIDQVAYDWGMAMGPNAVTDLSGIDVFFKLNSEWKNRPDDPAYFHMANVLYELGRYGQKTGAGFYKYEGRKAIPDSEVMNIAAREAKSLGITQREVSDDEIIKRLFYTMINEGALILEEGMALRPGDIDVIYTNGFGFPRHHGGPMFYADSVGLSEIYESICNYRDRYGALYWTPAPLLKQLVAQNQNFSVWSK